jgi:hypothetical protein
MLLALAILLWASLAQAEGVICEVDNLAVTDIKEHSAKVTFRHDTGTKVEVRIMVSPLQWAQGEPLACTTCPCVATGLKSDTQYDVAAVASLMDGSDSGPVTGPVSFRTKKPTAERLQILEDRLDKLCQDLGGCE